MKCALRSLALLATLSLAGAFAEESLPNPFFPPDPWEGIPPAAALMFGEEEEELPNPFFPPDPWEDIPPSA